MGTPYYLFIQFCNNTKTNGYTVLIEQIDKFVQKHQLIPTNSKIVLGLSGGPDSVFLLHYLAHLQKKSSISLIAAHLDHEWRPDSAKDEQFCHKIAQKNNVFYVGDKLSKLSLEHKFNGSTEELGRKARRYFLESVKTEHHADYIALAHHLQDQQETFFIRLIRGATLTGLTAMRPKHGAYIRPLLQVNKREIITWLKQNNIAYLTDPSNELPTFLRNRIRANVLPALQACDNRFDANFLTTLNRLKETENFLEQLTAEKFDAISSAEKEHHSINIKQFLNLHPIMHYRTLLHWLIIENVPFSPTQAFLDEIIRFLNQPEGKTHYIHEQWSVVKRKGLAFIQTNKSI